MSYIFLAGSGEFTSTMNRVDLKLLSLIKDPDILIIPTAAGKEKKYRHWIDDGILHFKDLGFMAQGIDLTENKDAFREDYVSILDKSNFVYFSGGDPVYLLSSLQNTPFLAKLKEKIKQDNFLLAGSSAGAMFMCELIPFNVMESLFGFNKGKLSWKKALSIVDFVVIPHFNKFSKMLNFKYLKDKFFKSFPENSLIIGIDEDTGILSQDRKTFEVLGDNSVTLFKRGDEDKIYLNSEKFII